MEGLSEASRSLRLCDEFYWYGTVLKRVLLRGFVRSYFQSCGGRCWSETTDWKGGLWLSRSHKGIKVERPNQLQHKENKGSKRKGSAKLRVHRAFAMSFHSRDPFWKGYYFVRSDLHRNIFVWFVFINRRYFFTWRIVSITMPVKIRNDDDDDDDDLSLMTNYHSIQANDTRTPVLSACGGRQCSTSQWTPMATGQTSHSILVSNQRRLVFACCADVPDVPVASVVHVPCASLLPAECRDGRVNWHH